MARASLALCIAVLAAGQQREPPPTFSTRAELVLVDFVVTDRNHRPIRGLSAQDVVVKENGRSRPIVSFAAFGAATVPTDAPAGARFDPPRPPQEAMPFTAVVIDDGHLTPEQAARARPVVKALLARIGERRGGVSIVAPGSRISVAGMLPDDREALALAIDRVIGQRTVDYSTLPIADAEALSVDRGDEATRSRVAARFLALNPNLTAETASMYAKVRATEVAFDVRRHRNAFYGVASLSLDWLGRQPARRALIVVSAGFAREPDDTRYGEIVTRSMRANAPVHFIDVRGLRDAGLESVRYGAALDPRANHSPFAFSDASEGATALAKDTGGIVIEGTNDVSAAFGRVADSMASYYVLAYEAPAHAKPGFKKIAVEVRMPGARVRARRGYFVSASRAPVP